MNKAKTKSNSVISIYVSVYRFIIWVIIFFTIIVVGLFVIFSYNQLSGLNERTEKWKISLEANLRFAKESGFLSEESIQYNPKADGFIYTLDGEIIKSTTPNLQGLNITPSNLYRSTKNLTDGRIHIGLYPNFETELQQVYMVIRIGDKLITTYVSPEKFFPAEIAGADIFAIYKNSRIQYSNKLWWTGSMLEPKVFMLIEGRLFLVKTVRFDRMDSLDIAFFQDVTNLVISGFLFLFVIIATCLLVYLYLRGLAVKIKLLKKEQQIIVKTTETFSDRIVGLSESSYTLELYKDFISEARQLLDDVHTEFIENSHLLSLFRHFIAESGYLLEKINDEVDKRETLQQKALHDKDILIAEIHHRVKNNLQIISALLQIQGASETDPRISDFVMSATSRIHSIAYVHESLYSGSDVTSVTADEFFVNLVKDLCMITGLHDIDLELEIESLHLELNELVPLGLIFNELIINSMKYAFFDSNKGSIRLHMYSDTEGTGHVRYSDSGPGLPDKFESEHSEGLGLKLINDLISQLGGEFDILKEDGRTVFSFSFCLQTPQNSKSGFLS